jgi:hypothetical protein
MGNYANQFGKKIAQIEKNTLPRTINYPLMRIRKGLSSCGKQFVTLLRYD